MSVNVLAGTQVMSSLTGAQMETRIRSLLNEETAGFWASSEILNWINDICKEIAVRTLCLGSSEDITIVADTLEYTLTSTDYIAVVAATYNGAHGLEIAGPWALGKVSARVTQPTHFYHWDGKVGIMPVFATGKTPIGKTVKVYLAQAPATIASDATIPLPSIFDNAVRNGVCWYALEKDNQPARAERFKASFESDIARSRLDFFEPAEGEQG